MVLFSSGIGAQQPIFKKESFLTGRWARVLGAVLFLLWGIDLHAGFSRVDVLALSDNNSLKKSAIDTTNGFLYFMSSIG